VIDPIDNPAESPRWFRVNTMITKKATNGSIVASVVTKSVESWVKAAIIFVSEKL
jgi:hypothetical protein